MMGGLARGVRRSWPIGFYFGLFGVLLALATGVGVWFANTGSERQATTDAHKDAVFAASEAAEEIASAWSALEEQLVATAASPAVSAVLAAPEGCTLTFTGVGPFGSGHLDFLGRDGAVACTSLVAPASQPIPSSRDYVGAGWLAGVSEGPVRVGPVVDAQTGALVVVSVVPVPDGAGFVAAFLELESLGIGLADRFGGRLLLEFVVTTEDGSQILTRSVDGGRWVGASTAGSPFVEAAGGDVARADVDGRARIYGDAVVSELGWRVYAGAARDDVLDGATSAFRRALVVIAAALLLMLVISGLIYRRIAGPIRALSRAVRAQSDDRTHARLAINGPTEVVAVADEFNGLVDKLQRELAERERAEQAARDSERSYRTLFEDNPQPMWMWDPATLEFLAVNDAAVAHYGYSRDEFTAMHIHDIVPALENGKPRAELHEIERVHGDEQVGPLHHTGPWRHITRDGSEISVETTSHPLTFDGRDARFALAVDVTQRLAYEAQLRHLALHDELTGLANRTLLLDRLSTALEQATRHTATVGVLFLDLDRFKPVNDVHGHQAGNQLLMTLAERLVEGARPGETIARIGGDEFVVLCPELAGETEAISVAGRIEGLLATPFQLGSAEVFLTASIGVIMSAGEGTAEELLRDADAAMYRAKQRGGNRFEMFNDDIRIRALNTVQTGNELRRAIHAGELRLHYQPEIDLRTGACSGVEALVRWQHPTRGLLAPIDFVPLAENNGLIVPLGAWVLRTACRQAAEWRLDERAPQGVSVNLSAREIAQTDLVTRVSEALDQAKLDPSALRLEITETSIMEDPQSAGEVLASLRDLGVRLDIDDFGTGYSSLLYLRAYAVDFLKIDRSFVAGVGQNHQDDAIVASVIDLAHAFDIGVVAEGIETMAQAEILAEKDCDFGQGYLWARPVPARELPAAFRYIETLNRELIRTR